jgi:hypothetical protein
MKMINRWVCRPSPTPCTLSHHRNFSIRSSAACQNYWVANEHQSFDMRSHYIHKQKTRDAP